MDYCPRRGRQVLPDLECRAVSHLDVAAAQVIDHSFRPLTRLSPPVSQYLRNATGLVNR